jgi:hypothetical protein
VRLKNHLLTSLSTYIYFDASARATFCDLQVYAGAVPMEHLQDFDRHLTASLRRIADEGIDMQRMEAAIRRERRKVC